MPRIRRRWATPGAVARSAPRGSLSVSFQADAQGGPWGLLDQAPQGVVHRRQAVAGFQVGFHLWQPVRGPLGVGECSMGAAGSGHSYCGNRYRTFFAPPSTPLNPSLRQAITPDPRRVIHKNCG